MHEDSTETGRGMDIKSKENERAAEIAIATVKGWLSSHPASSIKQVVFNVFLDKDHDIYQRLLAEG